jgi:hypothetical protein
VAIAAGLLCGAALLPAIGSAHPGHVTGGTAPSYLQNGFIASLASAPQERAAEQLGRSSAVQPPAPTPPGPCTDKAKASMPIGAGHKHDDISAHAFQCRMEQVAFLPLKQQLSDRENVILGEIDVQHDLAAVAVTFPRAGVLFFDVSDPAQPKYLSRWDGTECDQLIIDINCGAFVDLSEDGKIAYLSVQKLTFLPTIPPDPNAIVQAGPGVEVIDVADPKNPVHVQTYPIAGEGGVHTVRSHTIPDGPSSSGKPRAPGDYVISNQNGVGIDIAKVERVGGRPFLRTVRQDPSTTFVEATIVNNEVHDTFIQNDPLDGRTYLYDAAGFATGFYVYDITDPSQPELVAEWDPTPECDQDWYGHTIDVTHRNGRRYVTMPAELFLQKDTNTASGMAEMTDEDKAEGCGNFVGNGDNVGPLWIVDATDFSKLGPANDLKSDAEADETDAALKANSLAALVTTWTNPAHRAAGSLTFSPHNQQIVGDKIYLSHYHGGVYVLDASAAFAGREERPKELGFIVPHGEPTRPLFGQPELMGIEQRFFTDFPLGRPEIWDAFYHRGYVLAADMTGGFYSLHYDGDPTGASCSAGPGPVSRFARRKSRVTRRGVRLRGRARGRSGCGATKRVQVSVARRVGRRCAFLRRTGRFTKARSCRRAVYLKAKGTRRWRFSKRANLPAGTYVVRVRAVNRAGNRERRTRKRNVLVRRVR